MAIQFLTPEGIAAVDDAVDAQDLQDIADLVHWAIQHDVQLNMAAEDDLSMDSGEHLDDSEIKDFWTQKNFSLHMYPEIYRQISDRITEATKEGFKDYLEAVGIDREIESNLLKYQLSTVHVYRPGDYLGQHIDCFDYGIVLYINDPSEYTGGDFKVTGTGQKLTPVKNRMLIVPSDILHEVEDIVSGVRMVFSGFIAIGPNSMEREV